MSSNRKVFPPYSKGLLQQRQAGYIPRNIIYVVFDWLLAIKCTRIVIPDSLSHERLNFNCLAGLPVTIAYRDKDSHKINTVSQDILAVNPCYLSILALDLDSETRLLLKPYKIKETTA